MGGAIGVAGRRMAHPGLAFASFFFSGRRRHTRSLRDWSSDVCSSDLTGASQPKYITITTAMNTHKFLLILWVFIAVVIVMYFGWLAPVQPVAVTLPIILIFSLVGIAGSYGVAWFGIRVNTFANSRTAFASLRGKPYPIYSIPLQAGMSIGMMLISVELLMMLF